jgi:hypothetical protein
MRKTFIEMCLNLLDLTPVHDMFHGVIPRQSSTPIGCIDLEVSYGTGDNKHREMLRFKVASFDIGYNCILGRPFVLKFMVVIHTAYATMKMLGSKDVITIKVDQQDALACENATLRYVGRFGENAAQEQSDKVANTQGDNTLLRSSTPKPPITGTPRPPSTKKDAYSTSPSIQHPANQSVDNKKKGADDKEILADPSNPDKKLWISTNLSPK